MEACKRSRKVNDKEDTPLDALIWGRLQEHINLEAIYSKLPRSELPRLRLVCKAWNQAVNQALEPRPFFPIIAEGCPDYFDTKYLNGLLSYNTTSQSYRFNRQPFSIPCTASSPFAVEGLVFCHHPKNVSQPGVFNIHNQTWHSIPNLSEYRSVVGLMVDTSERPYSFKLVVGSLDEKTKIYDSTTRSWSVMSSRLKKMAKAALSERQIINCMCVNNSVYISVGAEMLLVYSMERDAWRIMDFPEVIQKDEDNRGVHALGAWDGKIFTAREDCSEGKVTVWMLVDEAKEEWEEYFVITGGDYAFLDDCDFLNYGPSIYEELRLMPCFCDGYLLLYNWHYSHCLSYAGGMLNLTTCKWEKVKLPPRTVALQRETEDDDEGCDYLDGYLEKGFEEDSENSRVKVNFRQSMGPDNVYPKIEVLDAGYCCDKAPQAEKLPASTTGKMVVKPSPVLVSVAAKAAAGASSAGQMVMKKLPPKVAPPSLVYKIPVTLECDMCCFESDVRDEYEAHKRTKLHGIFEALQQQQKTGHWRNPLIVLNEYAIKNRLKVNYEIKGDEVIATVASGDSHVTGAARHGKLKKAKHMAAAAALERIMETYDPEFKFAKYLHKIGLKNWNPASSDEANKGGSSIGGNGDNGGSSIGDKEGKDRSATVGGNSSGNVVGLQNGSGGSGSKDGIQGKKGAYGGVEPTPSPALRHRSHPGISAHGHQPRPPITPHNVMPNQIMLPRSHHYISTQTQPAFYPQQPALWVGGIPYIPIHGMSPGPTTGMETYAPPPINYGAYGPYQGSVVNPVQEMVPGTSTLVAQYGVMQEQPQHQVPYSIRVNYSLQP